MKRYLGFMTRLNLRVAKRSLFYLLTVFLYAPQASDSDLGAFGQITYELVGEEAAL